MDLFMQSDTKRYKLTEEDEDKIFLLQVKIDKVDKQILDFPQIQQSIAVLRNTIEEFSKNQEDFKAKFSTLFSSIQTLTSDFSKHKNDLSTINEKLNLNSFNRIALLTDYKKIEEKLTTLQSKIANLTSDFSSQKTFIQKTVIPPEKLFNNTVSAKVYSEKINNSIRDNNQIKKLMFLSKNYNLCRNSPMTK